MPRISVPKMQKIISVAEGANLMSSLVEAGLPVASSCGGEGVCCKCKIRIVSGAAHLSAPNEVELFLRETNEVSADSRVSCQTQVHGDIEVDASYW